MSREADKELESAWRGGAPLKHAFIVIAPDDQKPQLELLRAARTIDDMEQLEAEHTRFVRRLRAGEFPVVGRNRSGAIERANPHNLFEEYLDVANGELNAPSQNLTHLTVVVEATAPNALWSARDQVVEGDTCEVAWNKFDLHYRSEVEKPKKRRRTSYAPYFRDAVKKILINDKKRIDLFIRADAIRTILNATLELFKSEFQARPPNPETVRQFLSRYAPPGFAGNPRIPT